MATFVQHSFIHSFIYDGLAINRRVNYLLMLMQLRLTALSAPHSKTTNAKKARNNNPEIMHANSVNCIVACTNHEHIETGREKAGEGVGREQKEEYTEIMNRMFQQAYWNMKLKNEQQEWDNKCTFHKCIFWNLCVSRAYLRDFIYMHEYPPKTVILHTRTQQLDFW